MVAEAGEGALAGEQIQQGGEIEQGDDEYVDGHFHDAADCREMPVEEQPKNCREQIHHARADSDYERHPAQQQIENAGPAVQYRKGSVVSFSAPHWRLRRRDRHCLLPVPGPTGAGQNNVVLAFVVVKDVSCPPSWGGYYGLDQTTGSLDLDRRIAVLAQSSRTAVIPFGGRDGTELARACTGVDLLATAYEAVVDRCGATVLEKLRAAEQRKGCSPAIWLTLPADAHGLTGDGLTAVTQFLTAGLGSVGVNLMTMDFGVDSAKQASSSLVTQSLNAAHEQPFRGCAMAGDFCTSSQIWSLMGATVMIGQNDTADEVFTTLGDVDGERGWAADGVGLGLGRSVDQPVSDLECHEEMCRRGQDRVEAAGVCGDVDHAPGPARSGVRRGRWGVAVTHRRSGAAGRGAVADSHVARGPLPAVDQVGGVTSRVPGCCSREWHTRRSGGPRVTAPTTARWTSRRHGRRCRVPRCRSFSGEDEIGPDTAGQCPGSGFNLKRASTAKDAMGLQRRGEPASRDRASLAVAADYR